MSETNLPQLQIKNHLEYCNFLEDKFLDNKINELKFIKGAIGQIDLVGSTAFTVSKTTVRETLEKESEIFETNLTGNKLDFEDEMLLTRNDLIKRDIIYGVKSIAYNGILMGKMRIIAKWLGLETLGTEGDKIIVFGENTKNVFIFCLVVTFIFQKKSKNGLQGFGFRSGVAEVTEENFLTIYKNSQNQYLTSLGNPISNAEKMESTAKDNTINIEPNLVKYLESDFNFKKNKEFYYFDETKNIPTEIKKEINELVKNFEEKDSQILFEKNSNFSITKKTPIAFLKLEVKGKPEIFLKDFIKALRENKILLLRLGVIKEGKTILICHPENSRTPSNSILEGLKKMLNLGFKFKAGLTQDYLWVGNITFASDQDANYDVMGQAINLAARIVYKTEVESPSILASNSFLDSIEQEGYIFPRQNLEPIEFLAKGFDKPMTAFRIESISIEESENSKEFRKNKNFSEIIVKISNLISNILFNKSKNYYFAINASNFLMSKIILFSGMNQNIPDEKISEIQREDFYALSNIVIADLKRNKNIIDTFESIVTKIPDLYFPQFLLDNLDENTISDLTKIALITFGRVYDFKVSTLKIALNFDEEKISKYENLNLISRNRKKAYAQLLPPLGYILDIRAADIDKFNLHKQISLYLWKNLKKEHKGTRNWYEKGRVLALHCRFTNADDLPKNLKNLLVEIFEYAIKERELLDLLIFESGLLDKISLTTKKELFYELALVNLKFHDINQAFNILTSIKKVRKSHILTKKVDFFLDICLFKLQITLDPSIELKRLMSDEKIWQMMNDEEIQLAENILEV